MLSVKCYFEISVEKAFQTWLQMSETKGELNPLEGVWSHSQGREVGNGWEGEMHGVTPSVWVFLLSKMVVIFNMSLFRCHWNHSLITILRKSASIFLSPSFSFLKQSLPLYFLHQNLMWRRRWQGEILNWLHAPLLSLLPALLSLPVWYRRDSVKQCSLQTCRRDILSILKEN